MERRVGITQTEINWSNVLFPDNLSLSVLWKSPNQQLTADDIMKAEDNPIGVRFGHDCGRCPWDGGESIIAFNSLDELIIFAHGLQESVLEFKEDWDNGSYLDYVTNLTERNQGLPEL